ERCRHVRIDVDVVATEEGLRVDGQLVDRAEEVEDAGAGRMIEDAHDDSPRAIRAAAVIPCVNPRSMGVASQSSGWRCSASMSAAIWARTAASVTSATWRVQRPFFRSSKGSGPHTAHSESV